MCPVLLVMYWWHRLFVLSNKLSDAEMGNNAYTWSNACSGAFNDFKGKLTVATCLPG